MVTEILKDISKSKEELQKELKILRAQLAVIEEYKLAEKKLEEEIELLKKIILKTSEAKDLHEALGIALVEICESTGWVLGQAWIPTKNKDSLDCSPAWHCKVSNLDNFRSQSEQYKPTKGIGLPGRVWDIKKPCWIRDITLDINFPRTESAREAGLKACFGVPILTKDGDVIVVIEFFMKVAKEEDAKLVELISTIAAQLGSIFERKQIEDILRQSEEKFRSVFENAGAGIVTIGPDGCFLQINSTFCKLVGYSKEELLKLKVTDITYSEDLEATNQILSEVKNKKRETVDLEKRYVRKDGSILWCHITAKWLFDSENNSTYGIGLIKDITESKRLQEEYHKIYERFTGIYNSSKDAIDFTSLDGRIFEFNEALLKLTGYSREELLAGKKYQDLTPPEYHEFEATIINEIIKTQKPVVYEKEYIRKDGSRVPIELTVFVVHGKDKKSIGLAAIIKDITEKKENEKEIRDINESLENRIKERTEELNKLNQELVLEIKEHIQTEKQLKANEEKYRKLIETANDAIFIIDADTAIVIDANKQAEILLGVSLNQIIGIPQINIHPKEENERYNKLFQDILKKEKIITEELFICHKDGRKIPVEISASVTEISNKKVVQCLYRDLSRWKQAEENKFKLECLIEHSTDGIIGTTTDGTIVSWNPGAEKIYGYSAKEVIGKSVLILVPEYDREKILQIIEILKQGEYVEQHEVKRIRKDGSEVYVSSHISPIKDSKGNITYCSAIVRDVTAQKRAEKLVKESEEKYKSLIANIPDVTWSTDLQGKTIYISPNVEEVYGFTQDEVCNSKNSNWFSRIHLDDVEYVKNAYNLLFEKNKRFDVEYRIKRKDGAWVWVHDRAISTYKKNGIKCADGVLYDVTEHKLAEEEHNRLVSIVKSSNVAIISITTEGIITSWNPGAEQIFGFTAKEIKNKPLYNLISTNHINLTMEVIKKIKQGESLEHYEIPCLSKNGKEIYACFAISTIKNKDGKTTGISVIGRDTTQFRLAEKELVEAKRKLSMLIDNLPGIAYRCANDSDWTMEYISEGCVELTGYKPSELVNNTKISFNSLIVQEYKKYVRDTIQEAIKKKKPYILEYRIKTKSGDEKWVWEKGSAVFSPNGEVSALEGFINDITERKKAEENSLLLASIVKSSSDAIISDTLEGIITSWNPGAEKLYGYKANEIVGKHFSILVPNERIHEAKEIITKIKKGELIEDYETERIRKDGTKVFVSITISPVKDTEGKMTGLSASARDITEKRRLQAELEKTRQKEERETEIKHLEELTSLPNKQDITSLLFSLVPLRESFPGIFNDIVKHYEELLNLSIKEKDQNLKQTITDELKIISEELFRLKAGPLDIMEIHSTVMKKKNKDFLLEKSNVYLEKARLMMLELMSNLVNHYRKHSLIHKGVNGNKAPLKV